MHDSTKVILVYWNGEQNSQRYAELVECVLLAHGDCSSKLLLR